MILIRHKSYKYFQTKERANVVKFPDQLSKAFGGPFWSLIISNFKTDSKLIYKASVFESKGGKQEVKTLYRSIVVYMTLSHFVS